MATASAVLGISVAIAASAAFARAPPHQLPPPQTSQALTSQSTLVLVPVLVREHDSNEAVFSLGSQDFSVTDDGVPRRSISSPIPTFSRSLW